MHALRLLRVGALGLTFAVASPALAHHSFAMFDMQKTIPITGKVTEVQWKNPHTWIHIQVPTNGKLVQWEIEGRSPNVLERRGWAKSTVQVGSNVTIWTHPLKNGEPKGSMVRIRLANGKELNGDTPSAVDTDEEGARE